MNKKGRTDVVIIILAIALLLAAVFYIVPYMTVTSKIKTIAEHSTPADLSSGEKDTGMQLKFYDADGNEITIPDWFKVNSVMYPTTSEFTIIKHSALACITRTNCPGYATNPAIDCWNLVCAIKGVASMDMGVSIINPPSSTVNFLNVAPSAVTPASFNTQLDKTSLAKLIPGQTKKWMTTTPISVAQYEGTTQSFSVSVTGTNEYTGTAISASDLISLTFGADPTGAFQVVISSPFSI